MQTDFEREMVDRGYQPPEIIPDGVIHRFNADGRKDKSAWYVFYADGPAGAFGDWSKSEKHTWSGGNGHGGNALNDQQRETLKEEIRKAKQARLKERQERQKKAAERAQAIWDKAELADNDHPYLKKKGVLSHGLKVHKSALVVPMYDTDQEISSLQFIGADGKKRFLKDGKKKGCTFIIKSTADDVFDTFSGSLGLTGAADGLLALKRVTNQADAELHINGRDLEAAEYALKFHPDILSWEILGKADEVKTTKERQLLFDALKSADEPLSPKDLAEITGLKPHYVRKTLLILIDEGNAIKTGYGKYIYGDRWGEPQHGGNSNNNNFYTGNSGNSGDTWNSGNSYDHEVSEVFPEGTKAGNSFSGNNNRKLSTSVPSVPGVPAQCKDCKANGKDGKCYEHSVFRFTHGKPEPLDIAALNCEH